MCRPLGSRRVRRWLLVGAPLLALTLVGAGLSMHGRRPHRAGTTPAPTADAQLAKISPPDAGHPDRRLTAAQRPPTGPSAPSGPTQRRFGYLNLNSIPWSEVTIDGRPVGHPTPLLKLKLQEGPHLVVLSNREQKLRKKLRLTIRAGATTWKVVPLK